MKAELVSEISTAFLELIFPLVLLLTDAGKQDLDNEEASVSWKEERERKCPRNPWKESKNSKEGFLETLGLYTELLTR